LRSIARRLLICRVQRFEECHQGSGLCRTEVFSVSWHVSPTLDHLADKLIFREAQSNTVECRSALTSLVMERMTVVTLFGLENQGTVALQSRPPLEVFCRNRLAAPGIHHGTPGCVLPEMSQGAEADCDQKNREDGNWPPLPALLPFARYKWKRQQDDDSNRWTNQEYGRLG
jgi:hypothetical protein